MLDYTGFKTINILNDSKFDFESWGTIKVLKKGEKHEIDTKE